MDANKESCTIIIMYTALPFILVILSLCSSVHGKRSSLRGKEYKHEVRVGVAQVWTSRRVTSRGWWPHTDPSRLDSSILTNTIAFITILIEESWEETRICHQTCWCSRCCNSCTAAGNDKRYYCGACCKYRWALDSRQPSCWNYIDRYTQVRPAKLVSLRTMLCLLACFARTT
jgi:hypothetical protein